MYWLGLRSYAAWLCLNPKWADNVLTGAIAFVNCMNIETFPSSYKLLSCSTLKSIIHLLRTFTWEPQGWASSFKIENKAFVTWYYWHLLWTESGYWHRNSSFWDLNCSLFKEIYIFSADALMFDTQLYYNARYMFEVWHIYIDLNLCIELIVYILSIVIKYCSQ